MEQRTVGDRMGAFGLLPVPSLPARAVLPNLIQYILHMNMRKKMVKEPLRAVTASSAGIKIISACLDLTL